MMDDLLRETFARHEADAPRPEELRAGIDRLATRRRRERPGAATASVVRGVVATSSFGSTGGYPRASTPTDMLALSTFMT